MSADEGAASTDDEGKKEEAFGDMLARASPSDTELSDSSEKIVFTEQKSELFYDSLWGITADHLQ